MVRTMCQSCGMPLGKDEEKGTNKDGSLSQKYCTHCFQKGEFTWKDATPEMMRVYCMGILTGEKHWPTFAAKMATNGIPKLDRWRVYRPQHTARSIAGRHH